MQGAGWRVIRVNSMGSSALLVAFFVSLGGAGLCLVASQSGRRSLVRSLELAVYLNLFLLSVSSAALLSAFLERDFSLLYVFEYSSRSLSDAYALTAFWAGQEGSLLLWAWLLAACTAIAVRVNSRKAPDLAPWAIFVLLVNSSFFLFLVNFVSDPFAPFPGPTPADGYGLNPLLQNPGMVIHPPALFLGYVGLTVPYAFALASLIRGRADALWIVRTRIWTLVSWLFLGAGILLGAQWAYVELGWGGYWAWDPVENASLMPWLTATALLHSALIQERRGMFRLWNVNLAIFTYFLVIFGTFITRSGVISSVHAFGRSSLGAYFLVFMAVNLLVALALVFRRRRVLVGGQAVESLLSREAVFLMASLTLCAMAFSVFCGTVLPVVSGFLTGTKIMVGPSFFNRVNVPVALFLMLLMAVCPLLVWSRTPARNLKRDLPLPLVLAAISAGITLGAGINSIGTVLVMALSGMVVGSVVTELRRGTALSLSRNGGSFPLAAARTVWGNRRRYGGYLVHLGMVVIFMGLAGAPLVREVTGTIRPTESISVGQFTLRYQGMRFEPGEDRLSVITSVRAYRDQRPVGYLRPEKRFYANREDQPTTEVSILSSWKEDLYVALTGYNRDGLASFRVMVNPFVPWLWLGGYIVVAGTVVAVWPRGRGTAAGDRGG